MASGANLIKPTHRGVKAYYETLERYAGQDISHETALRSTFQNLLAHAAKLHGWTLIPELSHPSKSGAVRLVGQVIQVSLETVRIVRSLPPDFGG